jgi:CspA family cold shock protein
VIGTVKWFKPDKQFGFIVPDAAGGDVFVHLNQLRKSGLDELREGERVEYDAETGRNGKVQAINIRTL